MSALELRGYGPEWLKKTYLLGVDLTLDDGSPYPEEIFTTALCKVSALSPQSSALR